MREGLRGRRVLVAGGTGLVGSALSVRLAEQGADVVVLAGHDLDQAERLAEKLSDGFRVSATALAADVTDGPAMDALPATLTDRGIDTLDGAVSCITAYDGRPRSVAELTAADFRRVVEVDLVGPFLLTRAVAPLLAGGVDPGIVLVTSLAGLRGRSMAAHLCAAKSGVVGLVQALARDLAPQGIAVNGVAPGPVIPDTTGDRPAHGPMGPGVAPSTPEEVAGLVTHLLSPSSGRTNGQVLVINGGQP